MNTSWEMPVISRKRVFAKSICRRSLATITPSLSTSRTASIWDSHSGFSILIESPVVTDISCPEQKKGVEATDSRERHFWRRDLGGPCGKGLKSDLPKENGE